jgi:type I restriction-modification system DNA methylase subunit
LRSKYRKKTLGEVFTPPLLVEETLGQLPDEVWQDTSKTFLDNSCGSGNFLVAVLERKLTHGHDPITALETIHGVDIMLDNVKECRRRLMAIAANAGADLTTFKNKRILVRNIVKADGLRYHYRFDNTPPYDQEEQQPLEKTGEELFDFGT